MPDRGLTRSLPQDVEAPVFDADLVRSVYTAHLERGACDPSRVVMLEFSSYLERYLWPNFSADASHAHLMSIVLVRRQRLAAQPARPLTLRPARPPGRQMINEKFRENVPGLEFLEAKVEGREAKVAALFSRVFALAARLGEATPEALLAAGAEAATETADEPAALAPQERLAFLVFLINAFQSLEQADVRAQVLRLVSLPLWHNLTPGALELQMRDHPQVRVPLRASMGRARVTLAPCRARPQLVRHWQYLQAREAVESAVRRARRALAAAAHPPRSAAKHRHAQEGELDEIEGAWG